MKVWHTENGYEVLRILPGRCNVFAMQHDGRFFVVDTSVKQARRRLLRAIDGLVAQGSEFIALVLTHAHFDHAANAVAVARRFGVPVYLHAQELPLAQSGLNAPIGGLFGPFRLADSAFVQRRLLWFGYEPIPQAQGIDGSLFESLGFPAVCLLYTPGHTPGSLSVLVDGEIALVGDAMHAVFPGNALPPYACDAPALRTSWQALLQSGCVLFLPSHGGGRFGEAVRRQLRVTRFV